jgi:hypothetical protein
MSGCVASVDDESAAGNTSVGRWSSVGSPVVISTSIHHLHRIAAVVLGSIIVGRRCQYNASPRSVVSLVEDRWETLLGMPAQR